MADNPYGDAPVDSSNPYGDAPAAASPHTAGQGRTGARLKGSIDESSRANRLLPLATATMVGGPVLGEAAGLLPLARGSRLTEELTPTVGARAKAITRGAAEGVKAERAAQPKGILKPTATVKGAAQGAMKGAREALPAPSKAFETIQAYREPRWKGSGQGPPVEKPLPEVRPIKPPERSAKSIERTPNEVRQAAAAAREKLANAPKPEGPKPVEPIKPTVTRRVPKEQVPPAPETAGSKALPPPTKGEKVGGALSKEEAETLQAEAERGETWKALNRTLNAIDKGKFKQLAKEKFKVDSRGDLTTTQLKEIYKEMAGKEWVTSHKALNPPK